MGHGETVLVVDDESGIRRISQDTLETFGYHARLAADGAEAVTIFARDHASIAVVIMDMTMPVMSGVSAIRALIRIDPERARHRHQRHQHELGIAKAVGPQVTHFLQKPYTAEELLKTLADALAPKPAADQPDPRR